MKTRIIHTRFWNDNFIEKLSVKEKLLFIYLLTNEKVNLIGMYEISDKRIKSDLEITQAELNSAKEKFSENGKVFFVDGWVRIVNHDKYNSFRGERIEKAKKRELVEVPESLIHYQRGIDTSIHTSIDTPNNHNHNNINNINNNILDIATDILNFYNKERNTKYRNAGLFVKNLEKCLKNHSVDEIKRAISNIKYDDFWNKAATPERIFRQSKEGQPKDYIEDLLNLKIKKEEYIKL